MTATQLLEFHEGFAWFVIFGNAIAGIWALAAHKVEALRTRALWWFTAFAEVCIFIQVGLGVAVQQGEGIEPEQFHMFYGFVAIIAVGIIYSYRQQMEPHRFLLYGFGGLFLMGLGIRAMLVG